MKFDHSTWQQYVATWSDVDMDQANKVTFGKDDPHALVDFSNVLTALAGVREHVESLQQFVEGCEGLAGIMCAIEKQVRAMYAIAQAALDTQTQLSPALHQLLIASGFEGRETVSPSLVSTWSATHRAWNWVVDGPLAAREGWAVVDDGRCTMVKRVDPLPGELGANFASDADALAFVALRAICGSELHSRALRTVGPAGRR